MERQAHSHSLIDMPTLVSQFDAARILQCSKFVRLHARGVLTERELVDSLLIGALECDSSFGLGQCLAQSPPLLHATILALCDRIEATDGQWLSDRSQKFQDCSQDERRLRQQTGLAAVREAMAAPILDTEWTVDESDKWKLKWLQFKYLTTAPGERCRASNCIADRVLLGVFCPRHHFECLYGRDPENSE